MYLVTNRNILAESGLVEDVFSEKPNIKGPNELRVAAIKSSRAGWRAEVLDDELSDAELETLKLDHNLVLDPSVSYFRDLDVACKISNQAQQEKRNILIFVHGYNNNVKDVIKRATQLEKHYGVIVVPFSWPANGGGFKGLADYKDDKNDAKASVVALDRMLMLISRNLSIITSNNLRKFRAIAEEKYPSDPEKRDVLYANLVEKDCPFTINLMLHSMGNYLLKQLLKSSISKGTGLTFDNVVMVAADTNNLDHSFWVEHIRFKRRLYITINEEDQALAASRMKSGQDQLARLGHALYALNAARARYVNFTNTPWVSNSHAYFEGKPQARNKSVHQFFYTVLNGGVADKMLKYSEDINCYELRKP